MDESQSFLDLVKSGAQGEDPPRLRKFKDVADKQYTDADVESQGEPHGFPGNKCLGPYDDSGNFFDAQITESHDVPDDIARRLLRYRHLLQTLLFRCQITTGCFLRPGCKVLVMLNSSFRGRLVSWVRFFR